MGRIKSLVVAMIVVVGSLGFAGFAALAEPAKQPAAASVKQAGLAAPTKQAAAQAKAKPTGSRNARLYFLREKGILGAMGGLAASTEILIDGKSAGKVEMGTFFVVDRPPGLTKIATHMKLAMADYEIEVPIEAGKTYYFGVGTRRGGAPCRICSTRPSRAAAASRSARHRPSRPLSPARACSGSSPPPAPPRSRN